MDTVGSDHRMVTCYMSVSYRSNKPPPRDPIRKIDWKKLSQNPQLGYDYSVEVRNRFDVLLQDDTIDTSEYSLLVKCAQTTALDMLPTKTAKNRFNPYADPEIEHHRNILKHASLAHRTAPSYITKDNLEKCKKKLDSVYTAVIERVVKQKTDILEKSHPEHRHHCSWKIIKEITSSSYTPVCKISGNSTEERLQTWQNHFQNLLGSDPPTSQQ